MEMVPWRQESGRQTGKAITWSSSWKASWRRQDWTKKMPVWAPWWWGKLWNSLSKSPEMEVCWERWRNSKRPAGGSRVSSLESSRCRGLWMETWELGRQRKQVVLGDLPPQETWLQLCCKRVFGLPRWLRVKNPPANSLDTGLIPVSGKIPWRRKW